MNLHRIGSATAAVALVAALVLVGGTPASAAVNTTPTPLTVLPSEITKGAATTSTAAGEASAIRMAQVYKFLASPATLAALRAQQAGTATPAQVQTIKDATTTTRTPTGLGKLVKGVGGATTVYTGFEMGTSVGGAISDGLTTRLWGVDKDRLVCEAAPSGSVGQGFLSFFAGSDCAALAASDAYAPSINSDATAGGGPDGFYGDGYTKTGVNSDGSYYFGCKYTGVPSGAKGFINCEILPGSRAQSMSENIAWCRMPDGSNEATSSRMTFGGNSTYERDSMTPGRVDWNCGAGRIVALVDRAMTQYGKDSPGMPWPGWDGSNTTWVAPGEKGYKPAPTGDPVRTVSCVIQGSDGKAYTSTGGEYRESEKDWSAMTPECKKLPPEVVPLKTSLIVNTPGVGSETVWESTTPAETVERLSGKKYADCANTVCVMDLEKNGTTCFSGTDCTGWFEDFQKNPEAYKCKYGSSVVSMDQCSSVYKPTFEPRAQETGEFYGDPATGQPKPNSPTKSEQDAAPIVPKGKASMDPSVDDDRVSCLPGGFTLNPIDWVLAPLKCAFAPRASVVRGLTTKVTTAAAATPAGQLQSAVSTWQLQTPSGCSGFTISAKFLGPPFEIANACPGTFLAPIAWWAQKFALLAACVAGFVSVRGSIAGVASFRGGDE